MVGKKKIDGGLFFGVQDRSDEVVIDWNVLWDQGKNGEEAGWSAEDPR